MDLFSKRSFVLQFPDNKKYVLKINRGSVGAQCIVGYSIAVVAGRPGIPEHMQSLHNAEVE